MAEVEVHVLLFPWPLQGHINPMLHLASAFLDAGLHVTFLHTDHNLRRRAAGATPHHPRLRLLSIPDGLPADHPRSVATLMELLHSMHTAGAAAFRALLREELEPRRSGPGAPAPPPVTCAVVDGIMPFAIAAAEELGVPALAFRTEMAGAFLCYLSVPRLLELGESPAASDEPVRGVPGMEGVLRRRDLPRVAPSEPEPARVLLAIADNAAHCAAVSSSRALILNAAASMEAPAIARIAPRVRGGGVFAVGPLHARPRPAGHEDDDSDGDGGCTAAWLDGHSDRSVVYVNLGSLTAISAEQLAELLHGLAAGGHPFLCVLGPDMLSSSASEVLRDAVAAAGGERAALVVEWSVRRDVHRVLRHRAVGCFFTHAGWNSVMEAAVEGVPTVCWPFFADQQTASRFVAAVWKTGLDMKDVACERGVVARMVREVMGSPEIRAAAEAMATQLRRDVAKGGSSATELERLVGYITNLTTVASTAASASSP